MATKMESSSIGEDSEERKYLKILILGDFSVGKTTLIKTYLELDDLPEAALDVFQEYRARIRYNGEEVDVGFFDLSPGPLAPERRKFYPTDVKAILLCFSVGHYESLKGVYNLWMHEARAHYGELIPMFLVGLRSDARYIDGPIEVRSLFKPNDRIVEKSEAENLHEKCHFYGDYMECSMHDRSSIVNVINKAFIAALGD